MQAKAIQKYELTAPQKLREVVYLVKKMKPMDAIERLPFARKKAAEPLAKVIKAAIANARQKGANDAELVFKEIEINEGPRLRRYRAGARGRAKPYRKKMSHIRVVLETKKVERLEVKKEEKEKLDMTNPANTIDTEKTKGVKKANSRKLKTKS